MILRPLARLLPAKRATRRRSTPPRRRAARRALLWGLAALFVVHLALAAAVETVLPHVRDPEYGYRERNAVALQRAHPDRPLVLVLGTSRTQNGIDPAAMDFSDAPGAPLAFNAGLSGSWPVHLRLTYHRLRDAGVRPAAVLIEVFPPTLSLPAEGADFLFADRAPYLTAADLRRLGPYLTDPATLRRKWAANRVNSLHALRTVVVSNLAPKWQPWQQIDYHREALDRVGFTPYPYDTVSDEYRARKRAGTEKIYAPVVRTLADTAFAARAFRDLVADCRGAGIPVAFFLTPESPAFRSWYTPASRATLAAFTRVLSDELGCPVFEAPTDYAEEDFADGHHLLRPAARRFSRELAARHIGPWLASAQAPAGDRR